MPSLTLTIAEIKAPGPGRSPGSIKGTDGTTLTFWPEKLGLFELGKTYEVEYTEKPSSNGGQPFRNVKNAKETGSIQAAAIASAANGKAPNSYRETSDKDAERMWVSCMAAALIKAGKVDLPKLGETVVILRRIWDTQWGKGASISQRAITAMRSQPIDEFPDWYTSENPAAGMQAAE